VGVAEFLLLSGNSPIKFGKLVAQPKNFAKKFPVLRSQFVIAWAHEIWPTALKERAFRRARPMSALPPKADIAEHGRHVRFVPKADMRRFIRSSRRGQNRQADAEN
jgi:hypothetical protein